MSGIPTSVVGIGEKKVKVEGNGEKKCSQRELLGGHWVFLRGLEILCCPVLCFVRFVLRKRGERRWLFIREVVTNKY